MKKAFRILFALLALGSAQAQAETFMLVVEELFDGSAAGQPLASVEGLMARMFELGHVTFDSGPYRPEVDWGRLEFAEPLSQAREGRAHYLAAILVQAQTLGSVPAADGPPGRMFAQLRAQARYYLWNAQNDTFLADGEYTLDNRGREQELPYQTLLPDNRGREQELPYQTLLFQVGNMVARELARLSRSPTAKG